MSKKKHKSPNPANAMPAMVAEARHASTPGTCSTSTPELRAQSLPPIAELAYLGTFLVSDRRRHTLTRTPRTSASAGERAMVWEHINFSYPLVVLVLSQVCSLHLLWSTAGGFLGKQAIYSAALWNFRKAVRSSTRLNMRMSEFSNDVRDYDIIINGLNNVQSRETRKMM